MYNIVTNAPNTYNVLISKGNIDKIGAVFEPFSESTVSGNYTLSKIEPGMMMHSNFHGIGGVDNSVCSSSVCLQIGGNTQANYIPTGRGGQRFYSKKGEVFRGRLVGHDPDGDPLTYTLLDSHSAAAGTIVLSADGNFEFTPVASYEGAFNFSYRMHDGKEYSHAYGAWIVVEPPALPAMASSRPMTVGNKLMVFSSV